MSALRIDVADLLTHPGARRPLHLQAVITDLGGAAARIQEPVALDLVLERVPEGIVARGAVRAHWEAECSICLRAVGADLDTGVAELYTTVPIVGETYPIEGHEIDLEQLVRDAALLELPLAPTCEATGRDCDGLGGIAGVPGDAVGSDEAGPDSDATDATPADPRWAALSELEL
jgi:uncharacterized protein